MQTLEQLRAEAQISRRLWVKVLGMLEQNWCTLQVGANASTELVFFTDHGGVFDWLATSDEAAAHAALRANGFMWLWQSSSFLKAAGMPTLPSPGLRHRHRPVYSSGQYWVAAPEGHRLPPAEGMGSRLASSDSDLQRFIDAQDMRWYEVIEELADGRKTTHWMWFVFPQLRGLGSSTLAHHYGLADPQEAAAYWDNAVLGSRLQSSVRLLLDLPASTQIHNVFGHTDAQKLRSCMTLFASVSSGDDKQEEVLARYFAGERCARTLEVIRQSPPARRMRFSC